MARLKIFYRYASAADYGALRDAVAAIGCTEIQTVREGIDYCTVTDDEADQIMDQIRAVPYVDFVHIVNEHFG